MWRDNFIKLFLVAVASIFLGGCSINTLDSFFDTADNCASGSKAEKAACLTDEYRDLCANSNFGIRDSLIKLQAMVGKDIGTRICKKHISVAVGPVVDGKNIAGSMDEQTEEQATRCYAKMDRERVLCNAKVKLDFLRSQFKAVCTSNIPWYESEDLMSSIVEKRDQVVDDARLRGNHIYANNAKWFCHTQAGAVGLGALAIKNVSGIETPTLKRVYAEPENEMVKAVFASAKSECAATPNNECVLPKAVDKLGKKFAQVCKGKTEKKAKEKALGDVVHARKFLAMLNPEHFEKSSFVWLCGRNRVFVKSEMVMASKKQIEKEQQEALAKQADIPAPARKARISRRKAKARKKNALKKNALWQARQKRVKLARLIKAKRRRANAARMAKKRRRRAPATTQSLPSGFGNMLQF